MPAQPVLDCGDLRQNAVKGIDLIGWFSDSWKLGVGLPLTLPAVVAPTAANVAEIRVPTDSVFYLHTFAPFICVADAVAFGNDGRQAPGPQLPDGTAGVFTLLVNGQPRDPYANVLTIGDYFNWSATPRLVVEGGPDVVVRAQFLVTASPAHPASFRDAGVRIAGRVVVRP